MIFQYLLGHRLLGRATSWEAGKARFPAGGEKAEAVMSPSLSPSPSLSCSTSRAPPPGKGTPSLLLKAASSWHERRPVAPSHVP